MPERRFHQMLRPPLATWSWWLAFEDDRLEIRVKSTLDADDVSEGIERYEVAGFLASQEPAEARNALRQLLVAFTEQS
jgi:hypothetical protein